MAIVFDSASLPARPAFASVAVVSPGAPPSVVRSRVLWAYSKGMGDVLDGRNPSIHALEDDERAPYWAGVRAGRVRVEAAYHAGQAVGFGDEPVDVPAAYRKAEADAWTDGLADAGEKRIERLHGDMEAMAEDADFQELLDRGIVRM